MRKGKWILFLLAIHISGVWAQVANLTRSDSLKEKAARWDIKFKADKAKADKWAADRDLAIRSITEHGLIELVGLENGRPFYLTTVNTNAALTVSTDRVWPGGPAGVNLSGDGQLIGEWDGGAVRTSHQELTGRVNQIDVANINHHSTHIAGTMIASGVEPAAKGMAYQATIAAYDWLNHEAEVALAAADGLTLSNHSYTHAAGWLYNLYSDGRWVWMGDAGISATEDYFFGLYSQSSRNFDDIACEAPYYLLVKAAGNDWAETGPAPGTQYWYYNGGNRILSTDPRDADGPWDSIPDDGTGKNILTVGAIDDIIDGDFSPANIAAKMSVLTAWGPADDGRIKPDLVTNGVGLYSSFASSDASYYSMSGSSTAAACATGSLALLQQHCRTTHSPGSLTAAALKALILHTARESGPNDGPDYSAGWGLLNTEAATGIITQDLTVPIRLQELDLANGANDSLRITASGSEPLKATICWTDPPGTPVFALNPPAPMLVNDLDLRITRVSDGQTTLPWRLDRNNPAAPATRGDNTIDNIEQVYIAVPAAGDYLVTVTHKGSLLNGSQNYAMVLTGGTLATFVPDIVPAIDTRLEYISNNHNSPNPGEGILTLDVAASSSDGLAHAISDFQGSFLLDPVLRNQVLDISFSGQIFPILSYGNRLETYDNNSASPDYGRVFYHYGFTGGTHVFIDSNPVRIATVVIHYQMTSERGQIAWNDGASDFKVWDETAADITGNEETLPLEFSDIAVPVELAQFDASDTGKFVQLTWTTQSENENLGFHLFRSERADGPYGQITTRIIRGAGTSQTMHHYQYEDQNVKKSKTYFYKLADIDYHGRTTYHGPLAITVSAPDIFALEQNYPNPFNPSTRISFSLSREGQASIIIYNLQGQVIKSVLEQTLRAGWHTITWDGRDDAGRSVPSGIYFYTLMSEELHKTRRMQLVK